MKCYDCDDGFGNCDLCMHRIFPCFAKPMIAFLPPERCLKIMHACIASIFVLDSSLHKKATVCLFLSGIYYNKQGCEMRKE